MVADLDAERLASVQEELGDAVGVYGCDVRCESDVRGLIEASGQRFARLDIVFANAGIGGFSPIVDVDIAEWMRGPSRSTCWARF